jgi:hypothetical protein
MDSHVINSIPDFIRRLSNENKDKKVFGSRMDKNGIYKFLDEALRKKLNFNALNQGVCWWA